MQCATPPVTLSIAGTDPSGGAGIHADLKTFTSLHTYGTAVVTSLTAQNTRGVQAVEPIRPEFVGQQLSSVLDDIPVDAIKTGMLYDKNVITSICSVLNDMYKTKKKTNVPNLVVDPVMVSTSGHVLLSSGSIDALKNDLLPLATLVTPNLPEAKILSDSRDDISNLDQMIVACQKIGKLGCRYVLCKGGHLPESEELIDVLYDSQTDQHTLLKSPRCNHQSTHGTGCTLSAAICANLAKGLQMQEAVNLAKDYIQNALVTSFKIGSGVGPVNHLSLTEPRLIPHRTSGNPTPFFDYLVKQNHVIWDEYTKTNAFVQGVRDGTLPLQSFLHFLRQDYLFLQNYARIFSLAAYKCEKYEDIEAATDIVKHIVRESRNHITLCEKWGVSKEELESTPEANHTVAYTRYVLDVSNSKSLLHLRVATAPCLMGYGEVGRWLYNDEQTKREGNPYWDWICEYAGSEYQEAVQLGFQVLEDSAAESGLTPSTLEELSQIFGKATRLEIGFFEQGLTRDLRY